MGAAMAPAATETLTAYFNDTGTKPQDYDLIVTGDLGAVGSEIFLQLMERKNFPLGSNYSDCGLLLYDRNKQDVHAGGSGCGCSAAVLCSYILDKMTAGELKNVLVIATGALMSPTSSQQGESIPDSPSVPSCKNGTYTVSGKISGGMNRKRAKRRWRCPSPEIYAYCRPPATVKFLFAAANHPAYSLWSVITWGKTWISAAFFRRPAPRP